MRKFLVVILVLLVLGLGGYLIYDMTQVHKAYQVEANALKSQVSKLEAEKKAAQNKESDDEIIGEYIYKNYTNACALSYKLELLEDGTFYRKDTCDNSTIIYGTYSVQDTQLILKQTFIHSSEVGSGYLENKDYTLADKIRDELKDMGIKLIDTKEGTIYKEGE